MPNNVVLNVGYTTIGQNAFADLFRDALQAGNIAPNSVIDIQLNFGAGAVTISEGAFSQNAISSLLSQYNVSLGAATVAFNQNTAPTIGSNAFAGLNVSSLQLPPQTTLQPNALQNLQNLQNLDVSQVTLPLVSNSLNLTRSTVAPLIVQMPTSSSATFSSGAVVIPPTGGANTTTVVFNGYVPPAATLQNMFTVGSSVQQPVQVSVNYATTSNISSDQVVALGSGLTSTVSGAPRTVSYSQVQAAIQAGSTTLTQGAALVSISQFAGDYFDYCTILPSAAQNALSQCVVTGLTADAIKSNVHTIPVPNTITPSNGVSENVIGLVSRMDLSVNGLKPTSFYIVDNFYDPSDASLPSLPLVAIFSKANTVGAFSPAVLCNGTLKDSGNGSVIVSGPLGVATSYCYGYSALGDGTTSNSKSNLLQTTSIGTTVSLYDKGVSATALKIATITYTATEFLIEFNPVQTTGSLPIVGCFEGYRPTLPAGMSMSVDFTNSANASNAALNKFSNDVASVITNNNSLQNLLTQIRNQSVPAGVIINPALPTQVVSISDELAALSKSDFNALSAWSALRAKFNTAVTGYAAYLTAITNYVNAAEMALRNNNGWVAQHAEFLKFSNTLPASISAVSVALLDTNANPGPIYVSAVAPYIAARLSIGIQAFKSCTVLGSIPNFEFLKNISKINDQTFNFCSILKSPINIPQNVASIGKMAYYNCVDTTGIDIQNALALREIGESAFEGCSKAAGSLSFSSAIGASVSVVTIGAKAFRGCTSLTDHLYFPPGLTSIGVSAFENCINLNGTIVFPRNPNFTVIPDKAFSGCSKLTGVSTNTGNGTSLQYLPGSGMTGNVPNGLIIPPSVVQIGNSAFQGCSSFAGELNLQNGTAIRTIGDSAFQNCASFTSLVLPNTVQYTTVSTNCFKNCTGLVALNLQPAITTVMDGAFSGCSKIANVPKFDNVNYIGNDAFNGCSGMTGPLVLGVYLDFIGNRAFFNCSFLTSATFLGPPTINLKATATIFGLTVPSDTKFYVNVFVDNGWAVTDVASVDNLVPINTALRALTGTGVTAKSITQVSFIDFNIYNPVNTKDIIIENYQSFAAFDNNATNGATTVVAATAWNDVYIPGILRGRSGAEAQQNINVVSAQQKQVSDVITPAVNLVQSDALNATTSTNDLIRELNGGVLAVGTAPAGGAITLVSQASATTNATSTPYWGVFTNAGNDYLYYSPTNGQLATLVTSGSSNINFFVTSTDISSAPTLASKYTHKVISVDSVGVIKVTSIIPIGYDVATGVAYTAVAPPTTYAAYTILKPAVTGASDKLYLSSIIAPPGTYFINSCTGTSGTPAAKYIANIVYVQLDGSIIMPEAQLNNNFMMIAAANQKATVNDIVADTYAIVPVVIPAIGANTSFVLYYKKGTAAPALVASNYYFIQSSDLAQFNNVVVHVSAGANGVPNGGLSVGYAGVVGSNKALTNYTTAMVAQNIPLYSDNETYINFENYLSGMLPLNETRFNNAVTSYNAKYAAYSLDFNSLKQKVTSVSTMLSSSMKGAALVTAFNNLDTATTAFNNANNSMADLTNGSYFSYGTLIELLKESLTGTGLNNSALGLNTIQSNTLNNADFGIYPFIRNGTYNSSALSAPILSLANDLTYVTSQINTFLTEYLYQQRVSNSSDFVGNTVASVNANVLFPVSPSSVAGSSKLYANLPIQQKIIADFAVGMITRWFNSTTTSAPAGGNLSFDSLRAVVLAEGNNNLLLNKQNILAWAQTTIIPYFVKNSVSIYQQFVNNNVVPTLAHIRESVAMYEQRRAAGDNDTVSNSKAQLAYDNSVTVNVTTTTFILDTSSTNAPVSTLPDGRLFFNSSTLASSNKLYLSPRNSASSTELFNGYADTIVVSSTTNLLKFKIVAVSTDSNGNRVIDVSNGAFISGSALSSGAVGIKTYQDLSNYTLTNLSLMNAYVWTQYNQGYIDVDGNAITGIKNYISWLKQSLTTKVGTVSAHVAVIDSAVQSVLDKINLVNVAEDSLTSFLTESTNTTLSSVDLAGAQMLAREMELFGFALNNQKNANNNLVPVITNGVVPIPDYESNWFVARIGAFWNSIVSLSTPIANRQAAYTNANTTFTNARYDRQTAMVNSYIANYPPDANLSIPLSTAYIREVAFKIFSSMPGYLKTNVNDIVGVVAQKLVAYVSARDTELGVLVGDVRALAAAKFQQTKITSTDSELKIANYTYSIAAYNRYLAVIDLAIVNGYFGAATGDNQFKTYMQEWNNAKAAADKLVAYSKIKPILFDFVYTTSAGYELTSFPLTAQGMGGYPVLSWFGLATRNGWLYQLSDNGYTAVLTPIQNNSVQMTAYSNAGTGTVNAAATPLSLPSTANFQTNLLTSNAVNSVQATAALTVFSFLEYKVVSIGYNSLASVADPSNPPAHIFKPNLFTLNATADANNNNAVLYSFTIGGNSYYGYQQSSDLITSWSKLSPTENVVVFYPGTNQPPANLFTASQNSLTTLCDNAAYVMIISPNGTTAFSGKVFSIYKYDPMGVSSGDLVVVGKLVNPVAPAVVPTATAYVVVGALQTVALNPIGNTTGINLVGDVVIPNQIRNVGISSFAGSALIKSLSFGAGPNAVSIGSNAFQSCLGLSEINLGPTVSAIGPSAFLNCTTATSLTLPPLPSAFSVVNHWAFLGCNNLGSSATKGNLVFNPNVQQINVQAFAGCSKLKCTQLNGGSGLNYLPQQLQKIGIGAFVGCVGLTGALNLNNVNVNGQFVSSISFLGSAAFMGCTGLNDVLSLPNNASYKNVLPYTFASMDAPMLSLIGQVLNFPNAPSPVAMKLTGAVDLTFTNVVTVQRDAFYKCAALSAINLSNNVTEVGVQSFMYCSGLIGNILIPASVKSIGDEAFRGCSGLNSLNIVSTMVSQTATEAWLSLGNSCFQDCTSLALSNTAGGLILPNTVAFIGDSAFQGCTSIVSVNIGSGLSRANSFGSLVFSGCTKLERVTLAFSFVSRDVAGQSVVKNAVLPNPNPNAITYNASFANCTALGIPSDTPIGTVQIQSGATGWTPGRAAFFNNLTIVINNRNITFYLKEFNQNITVVDPSQEAVQTEAIPLTDAQATVHIKASDMRKVFRTATDSFVNQNVPGDTGVEHGQLFFVLPEYFPKYLNVSNAHVVQGGIESYNASVYERLVKDDVMRYYAMSLFNSSDWVTLFANDTEMLENMVASSGLMPLVPDGETDENGKNLYNTGVLYNIMNELNKISTTTTTNPLIVHSTNYPSPTALDRWGGLPDSVTPEQGNIGKKLFNLINRNDPGRVNSMVLNGTTPSELPFLPGDQFIFVFTLNENKVTLTPELPSMVVKKRTYLIKLMLTEDFNAGSPAFMDHAVALYTPSPLNQNVLPVSGAYAADYMYSNYNMYLAAKPSVLNQTTSSVYSRITQNTYEPIPMPVATLPFTGWYYSYPTSSQSIKLDFTPPDLSLTNKTLYSDMRYLSAYVYFPNTWSSSSALPHANNFPQWVVSFTNDAQTVTFRYKAGFLSANAETVNFLGQTLPFDYSNTHVQLLCPFDLTAIVANFGTTAPLNGLLSGKTAPDATGQTQSGTINTIAGTDIWRQRSNLSLVSGLRKSSSTVGPFTYPPISRGYQCIPMATTTPNGLTPSQVLVNGIAQTNVTVVNNLISTIIGAQTIGVTAYRLQSVALEINMSNNDGFVPSIIVKSVEVVSKNYEAYYLAPLDPN